jgi:predicted PurR-regulated permease PerM
VSERNVLSLRRLLPLAGVIVFIALAFVLRGVILALFFAFLAAYAMDPVVDRVEQVRVPRGLAALLVMAAFAGVLVTVIFFSVPVVVHEFAEASARLPEQLSTLQRNAGQWLWERFHFRLPATWGELASKYGAELRTHAPGASSVANALFGTVGVIFVLLGSLIIPVFTFYLLVDFNQIIDRTRTLIPRRFAPSVEGLVGEVNSMLKRYVRGQLLTCLILAVLYATALRVVGIRLAIPIGVITGLLAFVPYVGLGFGILLAVSMAVLEWHSAAHLLAVVGVMGAIGIFDAMVITPRIVGGSVGLRPLEVLVTMAAAAALFGFLGVLFAVPLGAVLKILIRRGTDAYLRSRLYRDPPQAAGRSEPLREGESDGREGSQADPADGLARPPPAGVAAGGPSGVG